MSSEPARITVERLHPEDVKDRQIHVDLDGQRIGNLSFGRSASREVAPGVHRLKANNTLFWKNIAVDLQPGEHARFQVANLPGRGTLSLLGFLGVGPLFLEFKRLDGPSASTA